MSSAREPVSSAHPPTVPAGPGSTDMSPRAPILLLLALATSAETTGAASGADLRDQLGRNETRIYAARYPIEPGRTVAALALADRLERRGYVRVRGRRPTRPGEYFWGYERFWIYRPAVRIGSRKERARLFGLSLRRSDQLVLGVLDEAEEPLSLKHSWLAPTLLAESFEPNRALTLRARYDELPEILWRAVLAAEDARFFDHIGLDARALARATLKNAKAGRVVQGGSTITQQLVKMRDLSPKRSLGRKASEALRALAIEAEFEKTEILEAYLNAVYFGHIEGRHLYGVGTAARAYFSKPVESLDLSESALLAAMIQGPNRLSPVRNPETVLDRYRWVLKRLGDLGWATAARIDLARKSLPKLDPSPPRLPAARHFLDWIESDVERRAPGLVRDDRGVVVYSSLDPLLQEAAETAVSAGLARLRASDRRLRSTSLTAALVALDGRTGEVLAYVGGDPERRDDAFDRARRARRQPGSAVKPLVLLEAFQACGDRGELYPARRISDRALTLELPSGDWSPQNPDRTFREAVTVRQATVQSLNVPFVRIARWCGLEATARRAGRAGLDLPDKPPPSFALGAVEASPLRLARAYTVFTNLGRASKPLPWTEMLLPEGSRLERRDPERRKVVSAASAFLIRDLLEASMSAGPAAAGALDAPGAFGKTGTSSSSRDAWFAGGADSLVAVVWVGLDDAEPLGYSGTRAAAPIWKAFMERAVPLRPAYTQDRPKGVVERWIQTDTGLLTSRERKGTELELFRRGATPPKRRLLRRDSPLEPIE